MDILFLEITGIVILGLLGIIFKNLKSRIDKNENDTENLKITLLKDYVTKIDVNVLLERINASLIRIESKIDKKEDKRLK